MDRRDQSRLIRVIGLLLVLGTLAVYGQTLFHGFVDFDDPDYVTKNSHVQAGLTFEGILWAFRTGHACNWHPLTWLSHMADCQLYGLSPGGPHFTNLLFHTANVLLLFGLLRRLTGAVWRSAIVAALFAWHPLHVESVAWVSERKDVLSTFFWLLTTWAYWRYAEASKVQSPRSKVFYFAALGFFLLGLLSKPMLVTLPFVLLLMDYWPLGRIRNLRASINCSSACEGAADCSPIPHSALRTPHSLVFLITEKLPFFALAAISSIITFFVQKSGGAVATLGALKPAHRLANALVSYVRYLGKMFWPDNLAVFYPIGPPWADWRVIAAALLLLAVTILAVMQMRRRPWLFVGWFWYLGTLVPVIGLIQVGSQSIADRYTYVPLIGIFIMLVWGLAELPETRPRLRVALSAGTAVILAILLPLSIAQAHYWRDDLALFGHTLAVTTNNAVAESNYGLALDNAGRDDEALSHFNASLRLVPNSPVTFYNIGLLYARRGDVQSALDYYHQALSLRPEYSDAHYNLGNLLTAQGQLPEAAEEYAASLRAEPDSADAHNNLGAVLARQGSPDRAMEEFKAALRIKPNFPEAQDQLGGVLQKLNRLEEARIHYAEAIRLKPDFAHAELKLGAVLAQQAQFPEAKIHLARAVELEPTNAIAWYNLASIHEVQGDWDEAAKGFAEAVRLKPNDPYNHQRLAAALAKLGHPDDARAQYREALRLKPEFPEALKGLNELEAAK